jgi:glycerol-3-phosphate cytidylyltransferase
VGRIVGYAPGAYDLFHVGHLNLLKHAKSQCDYLVAGVVSDEKCERTKGIRPFVPLLERAEIVRNIVFVDEVYEEHVATKLEAWGDLRFHRIFKGDDWRGTPKGVQLEHDFAGVGVEVVYLPYTMHTSSSMLRRALSYSLPSEEELRSY